MHMLIARISHRSYLDLFVEGECSGLSLICVSTLLEALLQFKFRLWNEYLNSQICRLVDPYVVVEFVGHWLKWSGRWVVVQA